MRCGTATGARTLASVVTMTGTTRGRLPAAVYWRRRLVLLAVVLLVVVGAVRLLGGGDDASAGAVSPDAGQRLAAQESPAATPDAQETTPPTAEELAAARARAEARAERKAQRRADRQAERAARAPLPEPEGTCADEDVVVAPVVDDAVAGRDVRVVLTLRTLAATACTWQMSPAHVTVKVTSGEDDIWSSRECPRQLERQEVVVRRDTTTSTSMTWNARRSQQGCPGNTLWAEPGYYHVDAASLGGEPHDVQFQLLDPAVIAAEEAAAAPEPEPAPRRGARQDRDATRKQDRAAG